MRTIATVAFAMVCSALFSAPAFAACDAARGGEISAQLCASCHGEGGNKPIADYPKIAGQHYDYIMQTMREYIAGKRGSAIMTQQIRSLDLSEDDLCSLAEYFAGQSGDLR